MMKPQEVYTLIQDMRNELNSRMDKLENNHINHIYMRMRGLEKQVWTATGATGVIVWIITQYLK